jgi:hypothetical protein
MRRKRRKHSLAFKAKVGMAALQGVKMLVDSIVTYLLEY